MRKIKNKYKYILMLIMVLNIPLLVKAQPANPAFSDDAFYTCVVDSYNSTNNKQYEYTTNLTDEELSTITNLTCRKQNENNTGEFYEIENTTGIDKLVNLESLYLSLKGETIDLSKNVKLKELYMYNSKNLASLDLSNNTDLTQLLIFSSKIETIDLSKNVKLKELYMYDSKNLTSLNLSNNLDLTTISIESSKFETIDLSKNANLMYLDINAENLKSLDLNKNIKLEDIYIYTSGITTLDLSKNVNLKKLIIRDDNLKSLDLSKNVNLENCYLFADNLAAIDLSKNVKLENLTINIPKSITKLNLDKNVKLKALNLRIDSDNISVYLAKGVETRLSNKNGVFIDISNSSKDSIVKIEKHMFSTVNDGSTVLTLADGKKINVFSGNYAPTDTSKKNIVKQNVKVENTASSFSIVLIIFSILLIIAGLTIMIKTKKNIKK